MTDARFTDVTAAALEAAGWTPGRNADLSGWLNELAAAGYRSNDVAEAALRSYGGLVIEPVSHGPNFTNDEPFTVDPVRAGTGNCFAFSQDLTRELGGQWYPLGEWLSFFSVFVDQSGWVVCIGSRWIWEMGTSIEDAIEFAARAHRPLRCLRAMDGVQPWPDTTLD